MGLPDGRRADGGGAEALAATPADLARYILGGAEGVHTPDREARAAACGGEG